MPRRHVAACCGHRKRRFDARDGEPRAERQRLERRQLDRWTGEYERAQRRDFVRGGRSRRAKRARGQKSHIAVSLELAPRPAFLPVIDDKALALELLAL